MPSFQVLGQDVQRLLVDLAEGERVYAEGGHLIWKSSTVKMTARAWEG